MDTLWQDVRQAVRALVKSPGFTAVAVLTLALGIGASTANFSLLDQVLLRRLPVQNPERLVVLRSPGEKTGHSTSDGDDAESFSFPMYKALREQNQALAGVLARYAAPVSVAYQGATDRAAGELVSGNYFEVLGVEPAVGRVFSLEDDKVPGGEPVVMLSYGFWMRRFGGNPQVLNQTLVVNGLPMTIVGVARAGFSGVQVGQAPDVFIPLMMKAQITPNWNGLDDWNDYWLALLGRMKPGMTPAQTAAGLQATYHGLLEEQVSVAGGKWQADHKARFVTPPIEVETGSRGRTTLQRDAQAPLVALFGMVVLVLLIVCTNVASLLMARAATRNREYAIRMALGAGRGRLTRAMLVESVLLSMLGGTLGIVLASWGLDALVAAMNTGADIRGLSAHLDARVLAFNFVLAVGTGILFGLVPALRFSRSDLNALMREQGGSATAGGGHVRLRKVFVGTQMALTVLLLTGAGLLTLTLWNLRKVNLGLKPDHLMMFSIAPELNGYTPARTVALCDQLTTALTGLPGVRAASVAEIGVLSGMDDNSNITVEGTVNRSEDERHIPRNWVGPGYFATLGIPLLVGREFSPADTTASPQVAIVNETFVRRFLAGKNPLGMRFVWGSGKTVQPEIEIVGVAQDGRYGHVRENAAPFAYLPYTQRPTLGRATFYVRTAQPPDAVAGSIRAAVARMDPALPIYDLKTGETLVDDDLFSERTVATLSISFAILAALLGCVGVYGVLAYVVTQRTREIGIRIALGALRVDIGRLILREVAALLAIGIGVGVPAAYGLGRVMESLLYGVHAGEAVVLLAGPAMLTAVAFAAAYLPARRATRVDPMIALRYE